ncbi:hypothetical protein [Cellulosimicrobium sp. CUA-896]|uniref:ATP-binding protein n=1 Tax=Cellulosimicrobium sp. CUA-896 TaxID=1517881 RepID=UPI00096989B9|nr:hypothetical protein [Cellulosimicrobium sp. CUA-896]OLT50919.1 hypothetical protein BJF88_02040 [Cellulosimicrobium sp. CUA-896]
MLREYGPARLDVTVRNTVPPGAAPAVGPRPGHGIIGMSERAAMVGGTLTAGRTPDGAWRVRLTVPRPVRDDDRRTATTEEAP